MSSKILFYRRGWKWLPLMCNINTKWGVFFITRSCYPLNLKLTILKPSLYSLVFILRYYSFNFNKLYFVKSAAYISKFRIFLLSIIFSVDRFKLSVLTIVTIKTVILNVYFSNQKFIKASLQVSFVNRHCTAFCTVQTKVINFF